MREINSKSERRKAGIVDGYEFSPAAEDPVHILRLRCFLVPSRPQVMDVARLMEGKGLVLALEEIVRLGVASDA